MIDNLNNDLVYEIFNTCVSNSNVGQPLVRVLNELIMHSPTSPYTISIQQCCLFTKYYSV